MRPIIIGLSFLLITTAAGCPAAEEDVTCDDLCTHLRSEILDGCQQDEADTQEECVAECEEHVDEGEVDQNGLACGVEAGTCEAWDLCGDFL